MNAVSSWQVKKINTIGHALGIGRGSRDDELHQLVLGITGKASIKELNFSEATAVIAELEKRQGGASPHKKTAKVYSEVPGGATAAQQRKALALMFELQKQSPSDAALTTRLCAIIHKDLHIDAVPYQEFRWMDFDAANKLIEVLKKYVANATKKQLHK